MAKDSTGTYQQAKSVLDGARLKQDIVIDIPEQDVKIFRKHLSELIKRRKINTRFASRILNKNQLKVIRIE
jgi:hypothetical protein